ncbi:MAG: hypothetical protein EXR99_15760, partial [Gemmataceae bacterium]|nr:hypothetical protein [Gemmataceae bacterium]
MEDLLTALDGCVSAEKILGYLNLSDGRPDSRCHASLNQAYAFLANHGDKQPWLTLAQWLEERLDEFKAAGATAFKNDRQARKTLELLAPFLEAYRAFHSDLLGHLDDADMFLPFFLARALETLLKLGLEKGFPRQPEPFLKLALERINDFTGYRPVAILETRPSGKPYPHEWFCCVPLYHRASGFAWGPYESLVRQALEILRSSDPSLLHEARLELEYLDEIALDVRGYDHSHPANLRPNFFFGEWDPHCIDNQGRFRRLVLRKSLLDIFLQMQEEGDAEQAFETAAVLAGAILMASAVTGILPGTHEASASLGTLVPRVARMRDTFYESLIALQEEPRRTRLREGKKQARQAFGQARQSLNTLLGRKRAAHVQRRFLALLLANMGHLDSARAEARKIEAASGRILAEILGILRLSHVEIERGLGAQAVERPGQAFQLVQRGIECGALADPWNILGFQGLFPLSPAREDSARDSRVDELLLIMEQIFLLISRLMSLAAADGDEALVAKLEEGLEAKAKWWDRFASWEVDGVRHVHGDENFYSAQIMARALLKWYHRGETLADLAFWKEQVASIHTTQAYSTVVDLLLRKGDQVATQGLLMSWLNQGMQTPLENGRHSFHALAARWLLITVVHRERMNASQVEGRHAAVRLFFDQLEANAEEIWGLSTLYDVFPDPAAKEDDPFHSAYESMSFQETQGDRHEGGISDPRPDSSFHLEEQAEDLLSNLRFLHSLARLWQITAYYLGMRSEANSKDLQALQRWKELASSRLKALRNFAIRWHNYPIPQPGNDADSLMEYQRRAQLREELVHWLVITEVEQARAVIAIQCALGEANQPPGEPWQEAFIVLERAIVAGDPAPVRLALAPFTKLLSKEKLLYLPLSRGGTPGRIFQVRLIQKCLNFLLLNLPRLGLVQETFALLTLAVKMEDPAPGKGQGVSEFNLHFQLAFSALLESVTEIADDIDDSDLVELLSQLLEPFEKLWITQSLTGKLSSCEALLDTNLFDRVRDFIETYGQDIFHPRFMTLGNLLGVMRHGTDKYLRALEENPDPLHPVKLAQALGDRITREEAARLLSVILPCVAENFDEFKDFNSSSTLSNYGNKLHVLLSFLRVKAVFERRAWMLVPALSVHEALVKAKRPKAAKLWQKQLADAT